MLYPVNLAVLGRVCLVVGGGEVAARKIDSLLTCGAVIKVVSPVVCSKIEALADHGEIEWRRRRYRRGDAQDAFLVFAATNDPVVQHQVEDEAQQSGALLNSVDNPQRSDFHVPAKLSRGALLITVSTGGASPALAARIRSRLADEYGPEYGLLVDLLRGIREQVVAECSEPQKNRQVFQDLLALPLLESIRLRNWEQLRRLAAGVLPAGVDCDRAVAALERGPSGERAAKR